MTESIPFRVSTMIKTIVGRELVTNPHIAIFELVKNSYDAYATHAWIIFKDLRKETGRRIIIADDGHGMSKDELENKWLFLGFSDKREDDTSPSRRRGPLGGPRLFAGAKGIGRFSCDTLGGNLILHTRKKGERTIHRLDVNWNQFDVDQSQEFQNMTASHSEEAKTSVEGFDLASMPHGTILEISSLREPWSIGMLRDLMKYLQRLVNPSVGETGAEEFIIDVKAEEFTGDDEEARRNPKRGLPIVNGPVRNFVFERLGIKTTHIHSRIKAGEIVTQLNDKDKLVYELKEKNKQKYLTDVDAKVFYLNRSAKVIFKRVMGLPPRKYGSVFLYKNEFRIHPYGDELDDWLGLEERRGQGYKRYLSKRDLIGYVILKGFQPEFKEASSRDSGLIKNSAYLELSNYIRKQVLSRLERYVREVIAWDTAAVQGAEDRQDIEAKTLEMASKLAGGARGPETTIKVGPGLLQTLDEQIATRYPSILGNLASIREHVASEQDQVILEKAIKAFKGALAKAEAQKLRMASTLEAKEQQVLFLKKTLSSDQEALLGHVHSITISTKTVQSELSKLRDWVLAQHAPANVVEALEECSIGLEKVLTLSKMATYATFDLAGEEIEADVVIFIRQYLQHFGKAVLGELRPIQLFNENVAFATMFKPVGLSIVIDNLLDNSRKNEASQVSIEFEKVNRELRVFFGDDGRGVETEETKNLFEIGYSTTGGSGLGLYGIRKIMRDMDGELAFVGNGKQGLGSGACFKVVFH